MYDDVYVIFFISFFFSSFFLYIRIGRHAPHTRATGALLGGWLRVTLALNTFLALRVDAIIAACCRGDVALAARLAHVALAGVRVALVWQRVWTLCRDEHSVDDVSNTVARWVVTRNDL